MNSRRPGPPIETATAVPILGMAVVADASPHGRRRRVLGGSLLAAVAVAILVARTLLAPGVPGSASPAPLPPPPPVGSCVLLLGEQVDVVPCDLPHSGEVAAAWPAGASPRVMMTGAAETASLTVSIKRQLPVAAKDQICDTWVRQYVGWTAIALTQGGSGRWIAPQPVVGGQLVEAPPSEGIPDRHWTACVVRTSQPLYTGTVRGAAYRTGNVPGAISVCIDIVSRGRGIRSLASGPSRRTDRGDGAVHADDGGSGRLPGAGPLRRSDGCASRWPRTGPAPPIRPSAANSKWSPSRRGCNVSYRSSSAPPAGSSRTA